jgi:hypothetical protein
MKIPKTMWLALAGAASTMVGGATLAQDPGPHLLFHVSAGKTLTAETAGGEAVPDFQSKVAIVPTGKSGGAIEWQDDGYVGAAVDVEHDGLRLVGLARRPDVEGQAVLINRYAPASPA